MTFNYHIFRHEYIYLDIERYSLAPFSLAYVSKFQYLFGTMLAVRKLRIRRCRRTCIIHIRRTAAPIITSSTNR